jgi:hypothetical protein
VDAWKKAKPILLMNTGISDLLRTLPYDPPQVKLGAYPAALTKLELEAAMKDQKIQKEKKALACLDLIAKDIKLYLQHIHKGRAGAIENIKIIHKAAKVFHADAAKVPQKSEPQRSGLWTRKWHDTILTSSASINHPQFPTSKALTLDKP